MMKRNDRPLRAAGAALFLLAAVAATGCEDSDPVAPADSTITVTANPQTVIVPSGSVGTTDITARVRSKNGTPLPDQEVTFSTTSGTLNPQADSPVITDGNGQAVSTLTTDGTATVTARSGSISGTTQVETSPGTLAPLVLQVFPTVMDNCDEQIMLTTTVLTTTAAPVPGFLVTFEEAPTSTISCDWDRAVNQTTDPNGIAMIVCDPNDNDCDAECRPSNDPNNPSTGSCLLFLRATIINGTVRSTDVQVDDNIP